MEDEINEYLEKNKHKYDDEFEQSRIVVDEVYEKIKALDTLDRDAILEFVFVSLANMLKATGKTTEQLQSVIELVDLCADLEPDKVIH